MKSSLKIAIDSGLLSGAHAVRGIGTYARELTRALNIEGVDLAAEDLGKFDIVHFTSFKPFEISIPFSKPKGTKFVLTIYDLIPLIYPGHYPPGIKGRVKWEINKHLIRKYIDVVITISETSKKDICRFTGIDPGKVVVIYLAAGSKFKKMENAESSGLPKRFALYVGDINYNKNIPNLIKACRLAKTPLVIAGKQASEIEKGNLDHAELKHLKDIDWSGVTRLGYISDEELVGHYNLAAVYVQPSYYEGFSLPLLEAYACGTPIAVSKNQCHVEILGGDFEYFDPENPEDIAKGIMHPNTGKKLPRDYSWEKAARETKNIYAKI